ncbi:MAG: DEAD/DEAH box helicase family protein [Burkholderiaceae bacterium]
MRSQASELNFQNDILAAMQANGWLLGKSAAYNRERALYESDLLAFVQTSQPDEWARYQAIYPVDPERHFLERVTQQLNKSDPNAAASLTHTELRTYGTLGVLRHEVRDRGCRFKLVQFKPDHNLNPDTLARYQANRLRVVPELVYSPYATAAHLAQTGRQAKAWRIDLVLFVNGIPVVTMELKSEFMQAIDNAKRQYCQTRLPRDPATNKPEPLLSFKRGALVHFAVSQFEVYMATRLAGDDTYFLPFNKGSAGGGAGNDAPLDANRYATDYLWNAVLLPDNLLQVLGRFVHLQIEEKEDWEGRKAKKESLIFPRYHQWDAVKQILASVALEGAGQKYLIQHSAGSGKSNSIAWVAHQLASLYDAQGDKQFHSVIVVTDRTVLDDQLQDTIHQFEHADGVVGRINNKDGDGSKSEKLAAALAQSQPIIIVTIQTFPFVLKAIEDSVILKTRRYAVIADEAHSSQSGSTASKLKQVLMLDARADGDDISSEDVVNDAIQASIVSRKGSSNLSYLAFTATPKAKTLELFGRLPHPALPPSQTNLPVAFHEYTMRQAIEEGFILDVLKNYTTYKVAYQLAQQAQALDAEVDSKKAGTRLNQWVKLHPTNIAQKVRIIIEHFRANVAGLLGGQAKAMVVTGSRKEAVRYKLAFDAYIAEKMASGRGGARGYEQIRAMVAFSGEVEDADSTYTERSMNPLLKGRDMRRAFDSDDFQVMLVANKFQTGFDQPKLCAMYVDKKLGGVECVQTLSRLNRVYPGKMESGTFVLDFFNDPQDIIDAFQPYYRSAALADVSNPNLVYDLQQKLNSLGIYQWQEVEQFCSAFYRKSVNKAALGNYCKPARDRWIGRHKSVLAALKIAKQMFERTKKTGDPVLMANAETSLKDCMLEKDRLEIFRKDLQSFSRFYEFMAQIVAYGDTRLEKLNLFAKHLRPMLREDTSVEDEVDLSTVVMTHYRLSEIRKQDLKLQQDSTDYKLQPGNDLGSGKPKDKLEELLSQILQRLNELFVTDGLSDADMVNYAYAILDKVRENSTVMDQIQNNSAEQALLGDFSKAVDDAVMDSSAAHQNQMMQYLSSPQIASGFSRVIFDLLLAGKGAVLPAREPV